MLNTGSPKKLTINSMEEKEERRAAVSRYSYDYISPISEPLPFGIERPEQNKNAYNDKQNAEDNAERIAFSRDNEQIDSVSYKQYSDNKIYPILNGICHNYEQHAYQHLQYRYYQTAVIVFSPDEINDADSAYANAENADYRYAKRGSVLPVKEKQERSDHGKHRTDKRVDRNIHIELTARRSRSRRRVMSVVFVVR